MTTKETLEIKEMLSLKNIGQDSISGFIASARLILFDLQLELSCRHYDEKARYSITTKAPFLTKEVLIERIFFFTKCVEDREDKKIFALSSFSELNPFAPSFEPCILYEDDGLCIVGSIGDDVGELLPYLLRS